MREPAETNDEVRKYTDFDGRLEIDTATAYVFKVFGFLQTFLLQINKITKEQMFNSVCYYTRAGEVKEVSFFRRMGAVYL